MPMNPPKTPNAKTRCPCNPGLSRTSVWKAGIRLSFLNRRKILAKTSITAATARKEIAVLQHERRHLLRACIAIIVSENGRRDAVKKRGRCPGARTPGGSPARRSM